jgi:hypothetical protein
MAEQARLVILVGKEAWGERWAFVGEYLVGGDDGQLPSGETARDERPCGITRDYATP